MPPKKRAASSKLSSAPKKGATGKTSKAKAAVVEEPESSESEMEVVPPKPKAAATKSKKVTKEKLAAAEPEVKDTPMTDSATAVATTSSSSSDPFKLRELFNGGEAWADLLIPVIESLPGAEQYISPARAKTFIPVREMTFQALKPNPPSQWKVVIFGEKPYPRIESATGISFFDADFDSWDDSRFGSVRSMKCIIKSALMAQAGVGKSTPIDEIKRLLKARDVVRPSEWFQAVLSQGCLLINAAFTASSDDSISATKHASFWRPVVVRIVEAILQEKEAQGLGVVFAWWGNHAKNVETFIAEIAKKFRVPIRHVRAANPAARNDAFCDSTALTDINTALVELKMDPIDWLPRHGWETKGGAAAADSARFGSFIQETKDLHKFFLERLQGVDQEKMEKLPGIIGIRETKVASLIDASKTLAHLPNVAAVVERSISFSKTKKSPLLSEDEVGALYLYTCESAFYKSLNENLRSANPIKIKPFHGVLKFMLLALDKLSAFPGDLWRGVKVDLKSSYPLGQTICWWGVSSCTSNKSVAHSFLGSSGSRTLFQIQPLSAVSIKEFSAFSGEDEYLLKPGTQLDVVGVETVSGLTTIKLKETTLPPLVA